MKEACDSMSSSTLWMSSIGALSVAVAQTSRIADPGWARDLTVIPSTVRVFHSADTGLEHNETAITPLVASHCMSPRSVLVGRLPHPYRQDTPVRCDGTTHRNLFAPLRRAMGRADLLFRASNRQTRGSR